MGKSEENFTLKNSLKTHQNRRKEENFDDENEDLNATFNCKFMDFLTDNQLKWKWIASFESIDEELGSDEKLCKEI